MSSSRSAASSGRCSNGTTWHAAAAKLSGGKWTIAVHNPSSGRVGLRSTVTDTRRDSSATTVYNAYAVS